MQMRCAVTVALLLFASTAMAHPPVSVVIDSRNNIYYSDLEQVWRIAPDGKRSVAVPNVHTHELFIDAQDNLFGEHLWYEGDATKKWGHYVWLRDAAGRVTMVKPRTEGFLTNYSFVRDRAGNMYWADRDHDRIIRRTPAGRNDVVVSSEFRDIRWMTAAPDGTLYLIDAGDLLRIARDGKRTRLAQLRRGPYVALLNRHDVQGMWLDRAGNVYAAYSAKRSVVRVTPAGVASVIVKSTVPWSPCGGAFAPNGDLLVLEYSATNEVRVRRVKIK